MPQPPKPKGKPDELAEVERALSVLGGRHPEHERARREDEEKRTRRAAAQESAARVANKQTRSRYIRLAAVAVPVLALIVFVGALGRREMVRRGRVDKAAEPYRAFGFATVDTSSPSTTGSLEANVEPGCILAVSTDPAPITVARGGTKTEGASPMLFCTCAAERVSVTSTVAKDGGLVLMRTDAPTLGGSRALAYAPFKPGSTLEGDAACTDASLDAWIEAKRYPPALADGRWLMGWPRRTALVAAGFKVAAVGWRDKPFVVLDVPKDSCLLATSELSADKLTLRMKGGVSPITDAAGTLVRCAQAEGTVLVSRQGAGELVVLVAPAAAVGGLLGVRELARENGLVVTSPATDVPSSDYAWDAKQTLLASQITDAIITTAATPDVAADADARVAALSFETSNALAPESAPDSYSFCEPALDDSMRQAVCVFSGSQKWRTAGAEAVGGLARSKLPFWLYSMQTANDPVALKAITRLLSLARKLGRDGFAPTTLEALTELPTGVEVLGRTGEDAVVAVGVAPAPPWAYPLSDAAAWTLDDAPRIVPLKALEKVTLVAAPKVQLPPKGMRRTVIFRRQKR